MEEVPAPVCKGGGVVVRTIYSLLSAGTERMLVRFGKKGLLQKAKERPDQLRQLMDKIRSDGMIAAFKAAFGRLSEPFPLGYSLTGRVVEVGSNVEGI